MPVECREFESGVKFEANNQLIICFIVLRKNVDQRWLENSNVKLVLPSN
jgi:hypothetical protein